MHHLVSDAISWKVLTNDLGASLARARHDLADNLPKKTTSLMEWSRLLRDYANSAAALDEVSYWRDRASINVRPLPVDFSGVNTNESSRAESAQLSIPETAMFYDRVRRDGFRVVDVLLMALVRALQSWTGAEAFVVDVMSNGRDAWFSDVDLSRSVGFFSSYTPVVLNVPLALSAEEKIEEITEQMNRIPTKGLGYDVIRCMRSASGGVDILERMPKSEILLNYLGKAQQGSQSFRQTLRRSPESPGCAPVPDCPSRSRNRHSLHPFRRESAINVRLQFKSTSTRDGQCLGCTLRVFPARVH